ncbi:PepSY domain-containing protein [Neobacillus sp. LXY-4]|uniref:PepSY domain-containing protein n=1 Tax=Neobacillus sp. LXY-4 TaxID=3379826 RepID=UPI003EE2E256
MKIKLMLGVLAGLVLLGGAVGVGAISDKGTNQNGNTSNVNVVKDDYYDDDYMKRDGDGSDDKLNQTKNPQGKISEEEAVAIATKETKGNVVKVELDDHYYEIEIKDGSYEVEYKIDLYTGKILDKEVDQDDSSNAD